MKYGELESNLIAVTTTILLVTIRIGIMMPDLGTTPTQLGSKIYESVGLWVNILIIQIDPPS